ncbi:MAG: LPS assembly lipoprotein LptE [Acetobacteraceae bacterium]
MRPRGFRRRIFLGAPLCLLGGCGFTPLYAPISTGGSSGAPSSDLAKVFVAVIPDRPGQLLREALQVRLEGSGTHEARIYTLRVNYGVSSEAIGFNPDSSSSYVRFRASANWSLLPLAPGSPALTAGLATAMDGYSVIVNQYFYTDLYNATIYRRLADEIAEQIVLRLAGYFRNQAKLARR